MGAFNVPHLKPDLMQARLLSELLYLRYRGNPTLNRGWLQLILNSLFQVIVLRGGGRATTQLANRSCSLALNLYE